jgi:hypothetical protein
MVIPGGDYRGDKKHPSGVSGWKGTALERRLTAIKKVSLKAPEKESPRKTPW